MNSIKSYSMPVLGSYMFSGAAFEKLPAIPRTPTKLRGFHRGTPQQPGSQPIIATTKATGQVLSVKASALYTCDADRVVELRVGNILYDHTSRFSDWSKEILRVTPQRFAQPCMPDWGIS
jgi:hypothetical protein